MFILVKRGLSVASLSMRGGRSARGAAAVHDRFPAGQVVHQDEQTLYNVHHFFEPNPIKRYSLGTKNKTLKLGPDGSLTIYVQAASPGADRESNSLPAPKGADFSLYGRAYWPKPAITDGTWTPPPGGAGGVSQAANLGRNNANAS
jgi:hypothetical protein